MRRSRLRFVALLGVWGACGSEKLESISSDVEAGPPSTPIYTRVRADDVTGDNPGVVVSGTSANCPATAPCLIADPGADSYLNDEFERPTGQGSAAVNYLPSLDITNAQTGLDASWLYYRINLYGVQPGTSPNDAISLPHYYGVEVNDDADLPGDFIVQINQPSLNVGTNWGTTGLEVRNDLNNTMGGPRALLPDGPGAAGGGYEHRVFDNGTNFTNGKVGGSTAVQARINGASVEIAMYRPFLVAISTDTPIDSFGFRPYAAAAQVSTSELYTHDDANRVQLGSPYPWLAQTGAPAACPNGSSGDDGLTAAQVAALESGTSVDTGILNPCYATGGIYQRDNSGSVTDLSYKDDLAVRVDLTLTKTDSRDPATQNQDLIYTLTAHNTQPVPVTHVVVTDVLPMSETFVSGSAGCSYDVLTRTVTCTASFLAGNADVQFLITVLPTALGTVVNTATVTSDGTEKTPANNTATASTTVIEACGNGVVDPGEGCDDGNHINGDGCEANCTLPNGAPCTDDGQCNSNTCDSQGSHTCEPANTCGNGHVEGTEACDDGNTTSGDGCEANCKLPLGAPCTSDGQCNSNTCDTQGSHTCEPANTCGNGHLEGTEACDDGNTVGGDTCEADCKLPNGSTCTGDNQCHSGVCDPTSGQCEPANTCGNGRLDAGETCDDGNTIGGDGCEADCRLPNGSGCTTDNQCHSGVCDPTSGQCEPANVCGNDRLDNGEACDDGNTTSGDGCEADCKLPLGSTCTMDSQCHSGVCDTQGSHTCEPANTCGNGHLEAGEGCDDGGIVPSDGCSATCHIDDGKSCNQTTPGDVGNASCTSDLCDTTDGLPGTCGGLDTDGDGVFDYADLDDDNDGILDTDEGNGTRDTDGDGAKDSRDLDSDNDGIPDATEAGHRFPDLDGNFIADCPNLAYGNNGYCNALETATDSGQPDFDGNGSADGIVRDTDGDGVADFVDLDSDNDAIADLVEGGSTCADANGDGICDGSDPDHDGIADSLDHTPPSASRFGTVGGTKVTDTDLDGTPDYRDLDSDNDKVFDIQESKNAALDKIVDGVIDAIDDHDGDGVRDVADDSDLDGIPDSEDADPPKFGGLHDPRIDSDGDGMPDFQDADSDNDTIGDGGDNCRTTPNTDQLDRDGDHIGDACDEQDDRSWGVQGAACGCDSHNSSPTGLLFVLGALGLVTTRRRRRGSGAALLLLGFVSLPATSHAQTVNSDFATERFQIASDRDGILDVESGAVRKDLQIDLASWLGYANDPLILNRTDMGTTHVGSLVSNQVSGELVGSVGLFGRAQLGLAVPLVFAQTDSIPSGLSSPTAPAGSFALGDMRVIPKYRLVPQSDFGIDLSIYAPLTFPTRSGSGFNGDRGVTFAPAVAVSRSFDNGWRAAANVGYRFRKQEMVYDLEINDEVFAGLGAAYKIGNGEVDSSFVVATAANDLFGSFNRNYAELKGGGSYHISGPFDVFAALGAGVAQGYGTPDWRALAGLRVNRDEGAEQPKPEVGDIDHDGIYDNVDKCPEQPEDKDGFQDEDGCPDKDDDADGIPDELDQCRMDPEDKDGFQDEDGCPEADNDKDGILDPNDKCPNEPEDLDKFQDEDGCPDADNDNDTVADAQDACPDVAGPVDNKGCPWPDTDNDGVIDKFDNCPKWRGTPENNGCMSPQLVKITESKLELYDTTFFATNRSTIQKRSFKLLNNVAEVIKNHPDLQITIEGHTDSQGSDKWNLKLSQARADAVKDYFIKRGVDPVHLTAVGYGEERPIADNKTAKGRAANRRVEFMANRIIETTTVVPSAPPAPAPTPAPK